MKPTLPMLVLLLPFLAQSQATIVYPPEVAAVLAKAAANRPELEKTISFFAKQKDTLKLKAAYFLIANMDMHRSANYYWVDGTGQRLPFEELSYPDFDAAVRAFEAIKQKVPDIHPKVNVYKDIDSIKATLLINNIERAFAAWQRPANRNTPFDIFCEYILPYRVSIEPLQDWRKSYEAKFLWLKDSGTNGKEAAQYFGGDFKKWVTNTYYTEQRKEPLPRLGALQLLQRKKGPCEDIADLAVFALRSQGLPATVDEVPYWATATGTHFINSTYDQAMRPVPFDVSSAAQRIAYRFAREPGKVIRLTYSKQKDALAAFEPKEKIPAGFMRNVNYKDVTQEYWETGDISTPLSPVTDSSVQTVYACVFNGLGWKPVWWGRMASGTTVFKNMGKGAVYLPMYYTNGKLRAAGYPVAFGYHHTLLLLPDTLQTHTVHLPQQEKYLQYREGKSYTLFYWNNRWVKIQSQTAKAATQQLHFGHVPKQALLLLLPSDAKDKERPFMVTDDGQRVWW